MSKAKDALLKHNNDYQKALQEINSQQINTQKLASRVVQEGLLAVYSHPAGFHSSLVELNSETDFVAKSPAFIQLIERIAHSAALMETGEGSSVIKTLNVESLLEKTLLESDTTQTVKQGITSVIGKLKENIQLRRGLVFNDDGTGLISGSYAHGASLPSGVGRVASIVVMKANVTNEKRTEIATFAKKLAQHVSGFAPLSISSCKDSPSESVLVEQPFLFGGGTVAQVIEDLSRKHNASIEIVDFKRFECGEGIEKKTDNFAEEVMAQIKK
jgi:elongation factor Ts